MHKRIAAILILILGCLAIPAAAAETVEKVGRIENPDISENSGLVASRKHANVLWTHNDSGNKPVLYAIDQTGKSLGEFRVDAENVDWEDISIDDDGHLYIGDIGDNLLQRRHLTIYQFDEPDPAQRGGKLKPKASWNVKAPVGAVNCEAMFVHKGNCYLITKEAPMISPTLYRFSLAEKGDQVIQLHQVGTIKEIRSPVTGASITSDGRQAAVLTLTGVYRWRNLVGNPDHMARLGPRFTRQFVGQAEACAIIKGGVLVAVELSRDLHLFKDE